MNHLEIALQEYGVKEIVGDKHNPRVVQYSQDIGNTWVTTDEVYWCSEYVNWCLLQVGMKGTNSAVARSFLKWGEETKTPRVGDIVVFWREPKGSNNGHVGFYINETPTTVRVLGGNQNDEVNITSFKKEQVLSYRKVPTLTHDEKVKSAVIVYLNQILSAIKGKK